MASKRNPIVALVMFLIPIVNLYLIYCWWKELKAAGKSDKDPLLWTILMIVPLVNIYALYVLFTKVDEVAKAAGKPSFPLGAVPLFIVALILSIFWVGILVFLYMAYQTQNIFNEAGI
ncbi:Uncharacterised protein [uncultured archaeon]|nr:Uncharacterised protein [uncultured archaeon]